jgi:hypothetical protein
MLKIRQFIRDMCLANPLWGAPRIHGELLKLGIDIGQTSVAKYMARRRRPPSRAGARYLRNHADSIAAMDLFVVPTISFRLLYGLLFLRRDRRRILWLSWRRAKSLCQSTISHVAFLPGLFGRMPRSRQNNHEQFRPCLPRRIDP